MSLASLAQPQNRRGGRRLGLWLLAATPFMLAACSDFERQAGQQLSALSTSSADPVMAPAPLPSYRPGQSFRFSDGQSLRVVSSDAGRVVWRDQDGGQRVTARNFVVPTLEAAGMERAVVNDAGGLWPLQVGKSDRMRIARTKVEPNGVRVSQGARNYNCRVSNTERITVAAGSYETYRVQCNRFSNSGKRLVETRVWHYAPAVGHFVRRDDIDRKTGWRERVELVGLSG
ncbi:MAG: hypothetical protein Kilf2KO_26890 [Rhodospirillales bacterium]